MKNLLALCLSILLCSCATLKVELPIEDGIKGYSGINKDTINMIALKNSERIGIFRHNSELNWGLAMSGGGIRSASFNIGALKGLYEIGLLDSINIISSVSGGSYASGWYYSHGVLIDPENMPKAMFNDSVILKNICDLQNKANMMKTQTMVSSIFLSKNKAFNRYKNGIQRTFLTDSIGKNKLNLFQNYVLDGTIPQFVINTTVSSSPTSDWLPGVFEYTAFNRGNPEIGFEKFNDNTFVNLNEAVTISGAAVKFKLQRKTNNYSSNIVGEYIPLSDGGHSENLGAISLIRRGVKNIIVIDAEHNDDYSFDGYKILRDSIKNELGLLLTVPSIDSFIKGGVKNLKTSIHVGQIKSIYLNPSYIKKPLIINIYYVKMAMPESIKTWLDNIELFALGDSINTEYKNSSCQIRKKNNKCKYYNGNLVSVHPSSLEFNALSIFWVKSYSEWLNNKSNWRKLNYTFPHTTTADQSFYRDQMAAFIGLGYLESLELKKYIYETK